jgi:purine-binding chemotaxis protein CheW
MEVITFTLGGEQYAIESRFALEVFRLSEFARLPGADGMIFGVTVWRGDLLTILDIRHALGLRTTALHDLTRVIVLGELRADFGVLADRVHEMRTIEHDDIESLPEGAGTGSRAYARGITNDAIIVLDAERLLTLHG